MLSWLRRPQSAPPNPADLSPRLTDRRAKSRGQSLVEFAFVVPVMILLLMIATDFGRAYLGWVNLNVATREAANYAALNPRGWVAGGDAVIQARYAMLVQNETSKINCAVAAPVPAPTFPSGATLGGDAEVSIDCAFTPITPLITAILGNTVTITSRAVFPIRTGGIASLPTSTGGGGGNPIPVANFSADQLNGVTPLDVTFTDLSSNAPSAWSWTFGDGGLSASQNPTHRYSVAGTYTVSLTASNMNGWDRETKATYITVTQPPPGPTADFTFSPPGGTAPVSITFTDTSTENPTTWAWDFGDGATATTKDASHTYVTDGTYTVRLTVTNGSGSNFVEKTVPIEHVICTVPNFAGVHTSNAASLWSDFGFTGAITYRAGSGNYKINYQSLQGGLVDPQPGGCASGIEVGP